MKRAEGLSNRFFMIFWLAVFLLAGRFGPVNRAGHAKALLPVPQGIVSAGHWHTCMLAPDGAVECWGLIDDGRAGTHAGPFGPYTPTLRNYLPAVALTSGR